MGAGVGFLVGVGVGFLVGVAVGVFVGVAVILGVGVGVVPKTMPLSGRGVGVEPNTIPDAAACGQKTPNTSAVRSPNTHRKRKRFLSLSCRLLSNTRATPVHMMVEMENRPIPLVISSDIIP